MSNLRDQLSAAITDKMRSSAKGAAAGAAIGGTVGALEIRKGSKKPKLAHIIKRIKQGSLSGAGAGAVYHDIKANINKNREEESLDDASNLVEVFGITDKLAAAKTSSQKLSQDLEMLAGWYERLAALTSKASKFVEKHPYVASALHWGAKKLSSN